MEETTVRFVVAVVVMVALLGYNYFTRNQVESDDVQAMRSLHAQHGTVSDGLVVGALLTFAGCVSFAIWLWVSVN